MSTPKLSTGATTDWRGTVISRTLKAWMAGYEMGHVEFAEGIDMNPRTFERRLKTGKFDVEEVRNCAHFMSRISGDRVPIADLFAGKISVFGPHESDRSVLSTEETSRTGSRQLLLPYLTLVTDKPTKSPPIRGHLRAVS